MSDVTFAIYYIGSQQALNDKLYFRVPSNVISIEKIFLFDALPPEQRQAGRCSGRSVDMFYAALRDFYMADDLARRLECFWRVLDAQRGLPADFTYGNLCRDRDAWNILVDVYQKWLAGQSFVDYFWTARFLHLPLWQLLMARDRVPRGRMYHSMCTGYAGWLAAAVARERGAGLLLSEHGLYTKERLEEINRVDWIYEPEPLHFDFSTDWRKLKEVWIDSFKFLSDVAYAQASTITTLFEKNARLQIDYGASQEKIQIIANGLPVQAYQGAFERHRMRWGRMPRPAVFGFVGRIVPVKDVKTLIRAAHIAMERYHDIEFLLYGPEEEDPDYVRECREMIEVLGLSRQLRFCGVGAVEKVMPEMDALILTSMSEGLPLVVLEAFAMGVPVIATDVGACRELIYGNSLEDRGCGQAGILTKIASPQDTADAVLELIRHPELFEKMGSAGHRRAELLYDETLMMQQYRQLYEEISKQYET